MKQTAQRRPSTGTVLGFAALVVALGGVASAAIPGQGGEIRGCYNRANGNLRGVESSADCRNNEAAITWNQTGPKGDPGAPGPPGPPGSSVGPTVFEDHTTAAQVITGGVRVASVTVPAGRYIVSGKTWAEDKGFNRNFVQCGLDGPPFEAVNENSRATLPPSGFETLMVQATIDVSTATTIELFCNPSAAAEVEFTVLTATSIGSINAQ